AERGGVEHSLLFRVEYRFCDCRVLSLWCELEVRFEFRHRRSLVTVTKLQHPKLVVRLGETRVGLDGGFEQGLRFRGLAGVQKARSLIEERLRVGTSARR